MRQRVEYKSFEELDGVERWIDFGHALAVLGYTESQLRAYAEQASEGGDLLRFGIVEHGSGKADRSLIVARHSLMYFIHHRVEGWRYVEEALDSLT